MATFTNQSPNAVSWANTSKATSSFTNQTLNTELALAGLYMGFGAFTYSGGQSVSVPASLITWTNQTKN